MRIILDDDGNKVKEGDTIVFSYGIPGVRVQAPIRMVNGVLYAITTGHKPDRCKLSDLRKYVGHFWKMGRLHE